MSGHQPSQPSLQPTSNHFGSSNSSLPSTSSPHLLKQLTSGHSRSSSSMTVSASAKSAVSQQSAGHQAASVQPGSSSEADQPSCKKLKLDIGLLSSMGGTRAASSAQSVGGLRKRLLEKRKARRARLLESYKDNMSEMFFLQSKVRIFCFKFSFNPLKFSLMRETGTKMTRTKSWAIVNNLPTCKKTIWHLAIWQNWCFGQFYHSKIEVLQIAQLLAIFIFVSFSLVRENLRGLRENFKHKIRLFKMTISPGINGTCCILSDSSFKMDPDPQSMRSATQRWPVFYGMSMIGNLGKIFIYTIMTCRHQ